MTTETNDAVTNDNVESGSLLSGAASATTENATNEGAVNETTADDFSYVPEKFLVDGKPDFEKMAKSYNELSSKLGSKIAPETIDEYDYQFKAEGIFDQDEGYQQLKEDMHNLGLSKDQFNGIMEMYEGATMDLINQLVPSPEKAQKTLSAEWGDKFATQLATARKAFDAFADETMDINEIGNNPTMIKLLASIGAQMGEDNPKGVNTNGGSGLTQTEVDGLMSRDDYFTNKEIQAKVAAFYARQTK